MAKEALVEADQNSGRLNIKFSLNLQTVIILVLLTVIGGMFLIWKPWEDQQAKLRTVEVTGETTLKAVPDEFVFNPYYEFKSPNQQTAMDAMTKKSEELVAKLKSLGVEESKIKTNAGGNSEPSVRASDKGNGGYLYALNLTVTCETKELAQKVQDYLITTSPVGAISPQAGFSEAKRIGLETRARRVAEEQAKAKAEESAANLGFKIASVKSVTDGTGFDGIIRPVAVGMRADVAETTASLNINPGLNELNYSVTVVYFIK